MATTVFPTAQIELTVENDNVLSHVKMLLRQMRGVVKVAVKKPNKAKAYDITKTAGYREAMADVAAGRVTKYDSLEEFFKEMGTNL